MRYKSNDLNPFNSHLWYLKNELIIKFINIVIYNKTFIFNLFDLEAPYSNPWFSMNIENLIVLLIFGSLQSMPLFHSYSKFYLALNGSFYY